MLTYRTRRSSCRALLAIVAALAILSSGGCSNGLVSDGTGDDPGDGSGDGADTGTGDDPGDGSEDGAGSGTGDGQSDAPGDGAGVEPPDCLSIDDHLECTYKTVGSMEIKADVYGSEEDADTAHPALLWIHGGALIFGHRVELAYADEQLELYLQRGYVVVSIDYRLAPATKLEHIQRDVADAHDWLRRVGPAAFGIDADRIGVVGHSAGGYLTLSLGFRVDPRPRALVSFYGYGTLGWYTEPSSAYLEEGEIDANDPDILAVQNGPPIANSPLSELDRRGKFYVYCRQTGRWPVEVAGRDPATDPSFFAQYEPLHNVSADNPPTILLHGQMDDDVPFQEASDMFEALDAAGVPVVFVHDGLPRYQGSYFEHGFDEDMDAPGVRQAFEEVLDFLDTNLKGPP